MPKVVKEFLLDESTGNVAVEFNDDSTATFNLSNAIGHWLLEARKLKLENATEEQVSIIAARYFTKGSKVRFVIWGDSTVYLKSTDLPGTTPGTATLAAFRFQIA